MHILQNGVEIPGIHDYPTPVRTPVLDIDDGCLTPIRPYPSLAAEAWFAAHRPPSDPEISVEEIEEIDLEEGP